MNNTLTNILILGSGGREHALVWKIKQSRHATKVYVAPGNAGTALVATNVPIDVTDFVQIRHFCIENEIQMVVVGPEVPLVEGISDFFQNDLMLKHIAVIGPSQQGAMLEGSKAYAKAFMMRHDIPTARYLAVTSDNLQEGIDFLGQLDAPYVLKADGLAAGKGVVILPQLADAKLELQAMLDGKFGKASKEVVIEEFLDGIEVSVFVLTDGSSYQVLPSAKDYKRIGVGDTGPNTGGMGAVSPVVFADKDFMGKVKTRIIQPTIDGLKKDAIDYKGFIFIGLMNVKGDPFVIEYNVRLGDPETECILPRIKSDFVELLKSCAYSQLNTYSLETDERYAVTVMLVSEGYPGDYPKGRMISGLDNVNDCIIFHAGTSFDIEKEKPKTNGGRVIAVTALDYILEDARVTAQVNAARIAYEGRYFRSDIGLDLVNYKPL
ncbi:MAG: phosphoribosylamine--glycine ligase [Bacteroidetes bacterium]|nr:MAG: phosphoribosylamine--glycine ligase [Bacteroidota bacterium]